MCFTFPVTAAVAIDPSLLSEVQSLEIRAIATAEANQYDEALQLLTQCIERCPEYASAYNNRAQVYQLLKQPDAAMKDCNTAIERARGDRHVLRQAYTQRALLHRTKGDDAAALSDYQKGGEYGNIYAKTEAVRLNPYAALCNQYLQMAMEKHWSGLGTTQEDANNDAASICTNSAATSNIACDSTTTKPAS